MKFFKSKRNIILIAVGAVVVIVLVVLALNKGDERNGIKVTAEKAEKGALSRSFPLTAKSSRRKILKSARIFRAK